MSIPQNLLSSIPVLGSFLPPDNIERTLLRDYELGGVGIGDTSQGLETTVWTLSYSSPDVIVTPDAGSAAVVFSIAGITELSLAFDQNMNPFIAYMLDGRAWYYWYDPIAVGYRHVKMAEGIISPRCCLDDKREHQTAVSDVILAYVRDEKLYYREQRDRFGVEYLLATGVVRHLNRVGMATNMRLHFEFQDNSVIIPPQTTPPEIELPYWDNIENNGWIDLSKCTQQSFQATFGDVIEGVDFQTVHTIGTGSAPIASKVNTTDGGNRLKLIGHSSFTEGTIFVTDSQGTVISYQHYDPSVGGTTAFVEVPTTGDHYVVTASDTGSAMIKKWDISDEHDTTNNPDFTGSIPWEQFFGSPLTTTGHWDTTTTIPAKGVSVAFTVPMTSDPAYIGFTNVGLTSITTTVTATVNQSSFDFRSGAKGSMGNGDAIGGIINNPTESTRNGRLIHLVPGQVYVFNFKNNSPGNPNWVRVQASAGLY